MQKRNDTDQIQAEAGWERTRLIETRHQKSIDKLPQQSIDTNNTTSIDNHPIPKTTVSEKDKLDNQYLTPDEFEANIDRQPSPPIDRRAPITYRVQMSKIDVARVNALRPKPKPSEQPPEPIRTPSDDRDDPMEEDRVSTGRTLRRRKEKVAKHLKKEANEKEKENFQKRKNSGGIVRDLKEQIGNALVPVDFHVLDIKLNWNSSLLLGRAFLSTVGAVCNLQTNQLCLTLIDPNVHYDPIPVKKPQAISRRINDAGIIAAYHCGAEYESYYSESIDTHPAISRRINDAGIIAAYHCGAEYESYYSESIDTHPVTSIDTNHTKSTDADKEKSVDTYPAEWENDYYNPTNDAYTRQTMHTDEYDEDFEEERSIEYIAILDEENKLLHHSSWKRNAPSFDMTSLPSIDTQPQQRCRKQASTDTAYYKSVDTDFHRVRDGDTQLIRFKHKLLGKELDRSTLVTRNQSTSFLNNRSTPTLPRRSTTIQYRKPLDPNGYAKAIDGRKLHVSREDIADILQTANGADNLFMHQGSNQEQKTINEFYDTAGGIENSFKQRSRHTPYPSINIDVPTVARQSEFGKRAYDFYGNMKFYWEEKDEYGVYRVDREIARDLDGHTIPVTPRISEDFWKELQEMNQPTYVFLNMLAHSHRQSWY
ncbi:hypothetical protein F2Q69_00047928 [Brassica cretica]|uniref:Uncharacterized protein n=1 Tax=Brassica cretica TaxID=69181 RepID=A0A8S9PVT0_BRACR|nr:hypothetical protein F2Q69_00047928 [Brassica cretica]